MPEKSYESTVMRIAGNLLSANPHLFSKQDDVINAVRVARLIVAEVFRTAPDTKSP